MKSQTQILIAFFMIVVASACSPALQTSPPEPTAPLSPPTMPPPPITATDSASVVIGYYGSLSVKNLDAAMQYVSDYPELCYTPACLKDKDQVRAYWEKEIATGFLPYVSIIKVEGNEVTYA